tara:strand:- start:3 stop:302 length:300 start_codon:yes stop_codon:yes gene_type:complete
MLFCGNVFSQITVTHFNAEWNNTNKVGWFEKLSDCDLVYVDIVKDPKLQQKHKIIIVPTIVIYKDGEEVKRFQADISFAMAATRREVQEAIDEQQMSDF